MKSGPSAWRWSAVAGEIAGRILDARDIPQFVKPLHGIDRHIDDRTRRNIVDDDRNAHGIVDRLAADEFQLFPGFAVSRPSDLWLLGYHRLYCGSALETTAYDVLLDGAKAATVFTDPPYNVKIDGHACGSGAIKHREFAMASGEMTSQTFERFLAEALRTHWRLHRSGRRHLRLHGLAAYGRDTRRRLRRSP